VERLLAGLFGAELSGLCRVREAGHDPKDSDLRQLCRCPECHRALRWKNGAAPCFECPQCGTFPQENGVHLLFRRAQLDALYRSPDASAGAAGASLDAHGRKNRSPHPLVEGARIAAVRLLNAQGNEALRVRSGEETVVRVWIECSRPLAHPIIGLVIRRLVGGASTVIYDTNTLWQNLRTGEYGAGEVIEIQFRQRMNLGPGSYPITVAIASHDAKKFYDWQEGILAFEVVESSGMQGLVNLHSTIEVAKRFLPGRPERGGEPTVKSSW